MTIITAKAVANASATTAAIKSASGAIARRLVKDTLMVPWE